jgi:tetratricopeptide (TPR) repeat protein
MLEKCEHGFLIIAFQLVAMEITKKEAFAKLIANHMKNHEDKKAYDLSISFVKKFPGELLSHILLAESAFRLRRFAEAKVEGRKALRYAQSENDLVFCAMIFSSACFHLKDYLEAYDLLKEISNRKQLANVEEALVVFSIAMKNEQDAIEHLRNLISLNRERALSLMKTYIHSLPSD